jgi:hypothetical protein
MQTPQVAPDRGGVQGTVTDPTGAVIAGARVRITPEDPALSQEKLSAGNGQFSFNNIPAGSFQLTVTSKGFAPKTATGTLSPGEIDTLPPIAMLVAANINVVEVELTKAEEAEREIKIEEKQRVLGMVPNFYVSYKPDAVALSPRQKFELAWKMVIDPVTLLMVGGAAGVEQAQNHFSGYGQGAQGYGKRFGANYADTVVGTFVGGAVLPSLLKQDPRYFYKGTGSKPSRFAYAVASVFICKGDNGRWQPNYSNVGGSLAAGGISNLYYPEANRNGPGLTFENAAIGLGAAAASNVLQEFIVRRFTPRASKPPKNAPSNP